MKLFLIILVTLMSIPFWPLFIGLAIVAWINCGFVWICEKAFEE